MPTTLAALAIARKQIETERGERLDDDELLAALASRVNSGDGPNKRAATQVAVTMCPACQTARQTAGNQAIALRPEELSRALCDVQWIDVTGQHRSVQDITPALRQKILARDHYRCRVPGCRATRCIEIHHIVPRELGGPHVPENLITLCDGHHAAHHRGDILIEGPPSTAVITRIAAIEADRMVRDEAVIEIETVESADFHVGDRSDQLHDFHEEESPEDRRYFHVEDRSDQNEERDAVLALTTLGFKKPVAAAAVAKARDQLDRSASLEELVRAALRECPR